MSRLTIIVAATRSNGIGQNGRLPWRLPKEISYFARVTSAAPEGSINAVLMGRNTWESIPKKFQPLPNRINIVMTRSKDYDIASGSSVVVHSDLPTAIARLTSTNISEKRVHRSFIIGGVSLYAESLALPPGSQAVFVDRILLTRIISPAFEQCDVFMSNFITKDEEESGWMRASHEELEAWVGFDVPGGVQEEKDVKYEFQMWVRNT